MHFYKTPDNHGFLTTEEPLEELDEYVEVTAEEYAEALEAATNPTPTAQELIKKEIRQLKNNLADTDYEAIKFAEGEMSAEDYAPYKAQRQQWRARINELELELE